MESIVQNNGMSTDVKQCMKDTISYSLKNFLAIFYIISPKETTKESAYDVPDYLVVLLPSVALLLSMEVVLRYVQRKDFIRFTDIVINSGSALLLSLTRLLLLTLTIPIMSWIQNNYAIVNLPLHSIWTWVICFLVVEFTNYWSHRAFHEFNILWAGHQFHHMTEDVNITTSGRECAVDLIVFSVMTLSLALVVPTPVMIVHVQFGVIYQVWLHNSVVGNLGFIEYLINTPRQHRVHHGKNPYCIDKNYGSVLMIWDRIFGTHQTENETITYGVVSPTPKTFDSMTLQFGYYREVWHKFQNAEGFANKMSALFKGPGWQPGKPRLGLISDVPEPDPNAPKYNYDPSIPDWKMWYIGVHGVVIMLGFYLLADHPNFLFSPGKGLIAMLYSIFVLTSFGTIFDNRKCAPIMEILRCLVYFPFDYFLIARVEWHIGRTMYLFLNIMLWSIRVLHIISVMFWLLYCVLSDIRDKSDDYRIVSKGGKDVESETSSVPKRKAIKAFCLLTALVLSSVPGLIAMMSRLDSCNVMFNSLYF